MRARLRADLPHARVRQLLHARANYIVYTALPPTSTRTWRRTSASRWAGPMPSGGQALASTGDGRAIYVYSPALPAQSLADCCSRLPRSRASNWLSTVLTTFDITSHTVSPQTPPRWSLRNSRSPPTGLFPPFPHPAGATRRAGTRCGRLTAASHHSRRGGGCGAGSDLLLPYSRDFTAVTHGDHQPTAVRRRGQSSTITEQVLPRWLASFRAAAPAGRPSCGLTVTTRSTLVSPSRPRAEPAV